MVFKWLNKCWLSLRIDVHRCNLPRAWLMDPVVAFGVTADCQPLISQPAYSRWWCFRLPAEVSLRVLNFKFCYEMVFGMQLARSWCYTVLSTWTQRKSHFAQDLCPSVLLWNHHVFQACRTFTLSWSCLPLTLCLSVFGVARALIFPNIYSNFNGSFSFSLLISFVF